MIQSLIVFLYMLVAFCSEAFQVLAPPTATTHLRAPPTTLLWMTSEDEPAKRRRKRVKRKEPIATASEAVEVKESSVELKQRNDAPVELRIQNVREVVGGKSFSPSSQGAQSSPKSESSMIIGDDLNAGSNDEDSLEQVLADAKAMRLDGDSAEKTGDALIAEKIRNGLSTIVTVDFFVVCALLLWFLAGIFGSYVLKDDTIQIAFNGIFQQVVQPALGILMIGSAASGK